MILKEENTTRNVWPLGLIVDTELDAQGFVRTVMVKTKEAVYKRPISYWPKKFSNNYVNFL